MFRGIVHTRAVQVLIFSRVIYALNWFNVAAVFSLIALDFRQNVAGLGFLVASFFIGIGIFQVPGGLLAAKYGPRKAAIVGTMASSIAVVLTGFATEFPQFLLLRFIAGSGMALVFASGVTLIARYYRKGSEGFAVGLYNAAFYTGGAIGLFGWAILGEIVGWRIAIILGGVLGILGGLALLIALPPEIVRKDFRVTREGFSKIFSDRWLILLSVAMLSGNVGSTLIGNFMILFLQQSQNASAAIAGLISSLVLVSSFLISPISGRLYDSSRNVTKLLFASGVGMSVGVAIASLETVPSALLGTLIVGFTSGAVTTAGFSAAREVKKLDPEYETLAVGWVNSISLTASFWSPVAFSLLVVHFGYRPAWLLAGAYTFALMVPILIWKRLGIKGSNALR